MIIELDGLSYCWWVLCPLAVPCLLGNPFLVQPGNHFTSSSCCSPAKGHREASGSWSCAPFLFLIGVCDILICGMSPVISVPLPDARMFTGRPHRTAAPMIDRALSLTSPAPTQGRASHNYPSTLFGCSLLAHMANLLYGMSSALPGKNLRVP